jgi:hypothetical protein
LKTTRDRIFFRVATNFSAINKKYNPIMCSIKSRVTDIKWCVTYQMMC